MDRSYADVSVCAHQINRGPINRCKLLICSCSSRLPVDFARNAQTWQNSCENMSGLIFSLRTSSISITNPCWRKAEIISIFLVLVFFLAFSIFGQAQQLMLKYKIALFSQHDFSKYGSLQFVDAPDHRPKYVSTFGQSKRRSLSVTRRHGKSRLLVDSVSHGQTVPQKMRQIMSSEHAQRHDDLHTENFVLISHVSNSVTAPFDCIETRTTVQIIRFVVPIFSRIN